MLTNRLARFLAASVLLPVSCCLAQKADFAVTVGGTFTSDAPATFQIICPGGVIPCPTVNGSVQSGHRVYVEITPGVRLFDAKAAALYVELPVAAIPSQTLQVSSAPGVSVGHLSSVFITPALRVKILPGAPINPFVSVGGGWAYYALDSGSNNRAALQVGGGVDLRTGTRHLRFRAEVRDFITAQPNFANVDSGPPALTSTGLNGLHRNNVLLGGGIVLNF